MPATLPLVNRQPITFESAIDQDGNFIHQTTFVAAQEALYRQLQGQREVMAALVQHHLNLSPLHGRTIIVAGRENWVRGGFNVCIPVKVVPPPSSSSVAKQILLIRCPLPYKLAEARYPGTVDEKLRSEVGAYAWMQEHCPDVRIPHLYGFGFSTQRQVIILYFNFLFLGCSVTHLRRYSAPNLHTNLTAPSISALSK